MLGGGMRQAGIIAAAGLVALDDHVEVLVADHRHARLLSQGLIELGYDVVLAETNIVNIM